MRERNVTIAPLLALLTAATFAGVLSNQFINFDDDFYVYNNGMVRRGLTWPSFQWAFTNMMASNWHPLTWLSLEVDYDLFGLHPAGYHAVNLALHITNTLVLYGLLCRWLGSPAPSALIAAFFAVHPLHVESVAWVSERKDVLSTLLLLLSLWCWSAYVERRRPGLYLLALGLFVVSLTAKSMGVTLPLLLLLLDFWPFGRLQSGDDGQEDGRLPRRLWRLVFEKLPFFAFSGVFSVLAMVAQRLGGATDFGQALSLTDRLRAVPVFYATYLRQTVWPANLAMFYPHPGTHVAWTKSCAALLLLLAITATSVRLRKPAPFLLVGWLIFLVSLLPVIGLVPIGAQATADRYMYLPMIGLLIAACVGALELSRRLGQHSSAVVGFALVLVVVCAVAAARQVRIWHDSVVAWRRVVEVTPPNVIAYNNYGMALAQQGRHHVGEPWIRKALEIEPDAYLPNCNLGLMLLEGGELDAAARHFEIALTRQPQNVLLLESLGQLEEDRGNLDAALRYYELAAASEPHSPTVLRRLNELRERLLQRGAGR